MLPFVAKMLVDLDVDTTYWADVLEGYRKRNTIIRNEIELLLIDLRRKIDDRIFVIENFGALLKSGDDIGLFSSGDVDVYVGKQLPQVYEFMKSRDGYTIEKSFINGFSVANEAADFTINFISQWVLRRVAPLKLCFDQCSLGSLDNTMLNDDELLYLCLLHISVHNFVREPGIRLYYDVLTLNADVQIWEKVVRYAEKDGYMLRVAIAAYVCKTCFEMPVPDILFPSEIVESSYFRKIVHIIFKKDEPRRLVTQLTRREKLFVEAYSDGMSPIRKATQLLYSKFYGHGR